MNNSMHIFENLKARVKQDTKEHDLKEIAQAFLIVYCDWPRQREYTISEFIAEFKEFFGHPFSREKFRNARDPENTWWRLESGAGMLKLLEQSQELYGEYDIDLIYNRIVDYYSDL